MVNVNNVAGLAATNFSQNHPIDSTYGDMVARVKASYSDAIKSFESQEPFSTQILKFTKLFNEIAALEPAHDLHAMHAFRGVLNQSAALTTFLRDTFFLSTSAHTMYDTIRGIMERVKVTSHVHSIDQNWAIEQGYEMAK